MFAKKGPCDRSLNWREKDAYGTRVADLCGESPHRKGGSTWFRAAKVVAHGREAPFPGRSDLLRLRRLKADSYPFACWYSSSLTIDAESAARSRAALATSWNRRMQQS